MKRLRRSYTTMEMDMGEGMAFHPVTGDKLSEHRYFCSKTFQIYVPTGCTSNHYYPRISDGCARQKGDPYLLHWQFDPETGKKLQEKKKEVPRSSIVRTGWELD